MSQRGVRAAAVKACLVIYNDKITENRRFASKNNTLLSKETNEGGNHAPNLPLTQTYSCKHASARKK